MTKKDKENLIKQIEDALNTIRPYLQADGGNVELKDISADKVVTLKLVGACGTCPMSMMTLKAGVEQALIKAVPGIRSVECVNITDFDDPKAVLPKNLQ